jgi:hypothetical protein
MHWPGSDSDVPAFQNKRIGVRIWLEFQDAFIVENVDAVEDFLRTFRSVRALCLRPDGNDRVENTNVRLGRAVGVKKVSNHFPENISGSMGSQTSRVGVDEAAVSGSVGTKAFVAMVEACQHVTEENLGTAASIWDFGHRPTLQDSSVREEIGLAVLESSRVMHLLKLLKNGFATFGSMLDFGATPRVEKRSVDA